MEEERKENSATNCKFDPCTASSSEGIYPCQCYCIRLRLYLSCFRFICISYVETNK